MAKRAGIRDAVEWIARNDDSDLGCPEEGGYLISIMLTADLFGLEPNDVYNRVVRFRARHGLTA